MNRTTIVAGWVVLALVGIALDLRWNGVARAQQQQPAKAAPTPIESSAESVFDNAEASGLTIGPANSSARYIIRKTESNRERQLGEKVRRLTNSLKHAEDDGTREQLREQLQEHLSLVFEEDLLARQRQIDEVKARLAKLEAVVAKRREAKGKIVDLQLQTLVNEAEGLGFSSDPNIGLPTQILSPMVPSIEPGTNSESDFGRNEDGFEDKNDESFKKAEDFPGTEPDPIR